MLPGATEWANFFVAAAGAAAALTGLVFVGVSIGVARILEFPKMGTLALEALLFFALVLLVALLGLVPQPVRLLGLELLLLALALAGALLALGRQLGQATPRQYSQKQWLNRGLSQLVALLLAVAAGYLLAGQPAGYYWLAGAVLLAFGRGLHDAWVVLLEFYR